MGRGRRETGWIEDVIEIADKDGAGADTGDRGRR